MSRAFVHQLHAFLSFFVASCLHHILLVFACSSTVILAQQIDLYCNQPLTNNISSLRVVAVPQAVADQQAGIPCDYTVIGVRAFSLSIASLDNIRAPPARHINIINCTFDQNIKLIPEFDQRQPISNSVNISRVVILSRAGGHEGSPLFIGIWNCRNEAGFKPLLQSVSISNNHFPHQLSNPSTMLRPQCRNLPAQLGYAEFINNKFTAVAECFVIAFLEDVEPPEFTTDVLPTTIVIAGNVVDGMAGVHAATAFGAMFVVSYIPVLQSLTVVDNRIDLVHTKSDHQPDLFWFHKLAIVLGNISFEGNRVHLYVRPRDSDGSVLEDFKTSEQFVLRDIYSMRGSTNIRHNVMYTDGVLSCVNLRFLRYLGDTANPPDMFIDDNEFTCIANATRAFSAITVMVGDMRTGIDVPLFTSNFRAIYLRRNKVVGSVVNTMPTLNCSVMRLVEIVGRVMIFQPLAITDIGLLLLSDNDVTGTVISQVTVLLFALYSNDFSSTMERVQAVHIRNNRILLTPDSRPNNAYAVGIQPTVSQWSHHVIVEHNIFDTRGVRGIVFAETIAGSCSVARGVMPESFKFGSIGFLTMRVTPARLVLSYNTMLASPLPSPSSLTFGWVRAVLSTQPNSANTIEVAGNLLRVFSLATGGSSSNNHNNGLTPALATGAITLFTFGPNFYIAPNLTSIVIRDNVIDNYATSGQVFIASLVNSSDKVPNSVITIISNNSIWCWNGVAGRATLGRMSIGRLMMSISVVLIPGMPPITATLVNSWQAVIEPVNEAPRVNIVELMSTSSGQNVEVSKNSIYIGLGGDTPPAQYYSILRTPPVVFSSSTVLLLSDNTVTASSSSGSSAAALVTIMSANGDSSAPSLGPFVSLVGNSVNCSSSSSPSSTSSCAFLALEPAVSLQQLNHHPLSVAATGNTFFTTSRQAFSLIAAATKAQEASIRSTSSVVIVFNVSTRAVAAAAAVETATGKCNVLRVGRTSKQRINRRLLSSSLASAALTINDDTGCEFTESHSQSSSVSQIVAPPPPPYQAPPATIANNVAQGVTMASAAFAAAAIPAMSFNVARQQAMASLVDRARTGSCAGIAPEITPGPAESPTQMQLGDSIGKWFAGAAVGNFIFSLSLVLVAQLCGTLFMKQTGSSSWNRPFAVFARCHVAMVLFVCLSLLASPSLSMALVVVTVAEVPLGLRIVAMLFALLLAGTTAVYTIWALFKRERKEKYKKLPRLPPHQQQQQPNFLQRGFTYWFEGAGEWVMPGGNKCTEQEHLAFDAANPQVDGFNNNAPWFSAVEFSTQLGLALAGFIAQLVPGDKSCVTQAVVIVVVLTSYLALALWKRPFQELFLRVFTPIMVVCQIVICVIVAAMASSGGIPAWIDALVVLTVSLQSVMSVLVVLAAIAPMSKWIMKAWKRMQSRRGVGDQRNARSASSRCSSSRRRPANDDGNSRLRGWSLRDLLRDDEDDERDTATARGSSRAFSPSPRSVEMLPRNHSSGSSRNNNSASQRSSSASPRQHHLPRATSSQQQVSEQQHRRGDREQSRREASVSNSGPRNNNTNSSRNNHSNVAAAPRRSNTGGNSIAASRVFI